MSKKGETLKTSLLPYRCSVTPFCFVCLVVAQPISEVPGGLMNYPVYKGKGNSHPTTGGEGPERERSYNSTFSLTSALDGG
jgi:hypothetical protein